MFSQTNRFTIHYLKSMKSFRVLSTVLFAICVAVSVFAPAEAAALLPAGAHDFLFGPDSVTFAATVSLTGISRLERQKTNLGGITKLILFGESDFTSEWPLKADILAGVLSEEPPLKAGVVGAVLKFDLNTCRVKSNRKGALGYQNIGVDGECKFAGYEATQIAAIEKTFNEGGVAIAIYKDGTRSVIGTSYEPLVFEDTTDSGAKADDMKQIDFKFKGDGYAFHPPVLDAAVVIPLPV